MAERTFIPRTIICAAAGPSAWPIPALRPSGPLAQRRCEPKLRSDASRDIALDSEGGGTSFGQPFRTTPEAGLKSEDLRIGTSSGRCELKSKGGRIEPGMVSSAGTCQPGARGRRAPLTSTQEARHSTSGTPRTRRTLSPAGRCWLIFFAEDQTCGARRGARPTVIPSVVPIDRGAGCRAIREARHACHGDRCDE